MSGGSEPSSCSAHPSERGISRELEQGGLRCGLLKELHVVSVAQTTAMDGTVLMYNCAMYYVFIYRCIMPNVRTLARSVKL